MQKLSTEAKRFIVQALACFDSPTEVVKSVKAELGIDIPRQNVEGYDPKKKAGKKLSPDLLELYETTRKAFLEDTTEIAVSHRSVRLRALQRMAERAESRNNLQLAAQLLEQAAKECGDAYTNRQKIDHSGEIKNSQPVINLTVTQ